MPTGAPPPRRHYAWVILAVTFVGLLVAQGVRLAFGAFVEPWEESFEISRGTVTLVSLVSFLVYGALQPTVGRVVERFDIPRLFAFGLLVIAGGLVLTAFASSPWALIATYGVVASFGFGIAASVLGSVLIARWFVEKRGLAFGVFEAGSGAGQLVIAPASLFMVDAWGWEATFLVFAAVTAFVIAPLMVIFLRNRPEDIGLEPLGGPDPGIDALPDGHVPVALRHRREFWYLMVPFFVCGITTTGMIDTHLIAFSHDHGNGDAITSVAVASLALFNIVGTAGSGLLVDAYDPRRILGWLYALRAVSLVVVLLLNEGFWLVQFGILFGLVDFATVAPTQTLVSRYFGADSMGFVFGLVLASHQVGSALGSYIPGVLHDATGGYGISFLGAAATLVVASALSFRLPPTMLPGVSRREAIST
ncbi:MAG: MFS transporter [Actinomycetota bacterium]